MRGGGRGPRSFLSRVPLPSPAPSITSSSSSSSSSSRPLRGSPPPPPLSLPLSSLPGRVCPRSLPPSASPSLLLSPLLLSRGLLAPPPCSPAPLVLSPRIPQRFASRAGPGGSKHGSSEPPHQAHSSVIQRRMIRDVPGLARGPPDAVERAFRLGGGEVRGPSGLDGTEV